MSDDSPFHPAYDESCAKSARVVTLTQALSDLVEVWPLCMVADCDSPRTNSAYCDEHRSPGTVDIVGLAALRAALVVLEGSTDDE